MAKSNKRPFSRLIDLLFLDKSDIVAIYFYAIMSGLVQLSVPIGIQSIIGFVMGASMVTSIYVLIFLVVLGVSLVGILEINQMKIIEKIQQNIFTRNAYLFAERIPRFDLLKVDNYYLPEKVNRFFDTINVQKGLSKLLLEVPTAVIQIFFGLVLLSFYNQLFILFGIILILVLWAILYFTSRRGIQTSLQESNHKYEVAAWFEEMARVIHSFKFSQGTNFNLRRADANVINYLQARTNHFSVLLLQFRILVVFKVLITMAMLIVGTYLLINQQLNVGEFIAAEIVILSVITAIEKLIGSVDSIYDVVTGLEKIASVTESPQEPDGLVFLTEPGLNIKIRDVSFAYSPDKVILKDIDLLINAHEKIALNGPEESGKSTLFKLLSGNYKDFKGSIFYNNIPIQNLKLEALRSKIGVYYDNEDLFNGTILENITMGKAIDPQQIVKTANDLGLATFLNSLIAGFDTKVDSSGKNLSRSVVRHILLLRATVHNPDMLLMEEPWLGFDINTKSSMINYFTKVFKGTVIIATNDTEYSNLADKRIVIIDGSTQVS